MQTQLKLTFMNHGLILTGPQCQTWWQDTMHLNGKKNTMSFNSTYADGIGMENITFNIYYKSDASPSIVSVSKFMSSNCASI